MVGSYQASSLVGCEAVPLDERLLVFQMIMVPSFSGSGSPSRLNCLELLDFLCERKGSK